MSSVEQTSTKGISFTFPVMSSVPSTDKSNFVQNPLATITGHVQVHNPAPNIAVNQQQAEITQIAPKALSAIPMLHETLEKMMSKMTQIENIMSQMQVNVPVSNLQYFQLPNLSSRPSRTLLIFNMTRFPCILESYSLSM